MPRPLAEYSGRDWLRLRPLVERWKHAGYGLTVAIHVRRPPARDDLAAARRAISGRPTIVTIAYNDAGFIAAQTALLRMNVPGCVHVIADNSTDDAAAAVIEAIAAKSGASYLRLKPGPWRRLEEAGRSHGLAMSWTWRNLLRPGRPSAFGFLDHDLFPTRPTDPFAPLQNHKVAGQIRNRSGRERWYLWAGFCFFRFDAVARCDLDFSLDWAAGLDTGGGNWFRLYRRLEPHEVFDAGVSFEAVDPDVPEAIARFEWVGDRLHVGDFNTPLGLPPERREVLRRLKRRRLREKLAALLPDTVGL